MFSCWHGNFLLGAARLGGERVLFFGMTWKASDFLSGLVEKKSTLSVLGKYRENQVRPENQLSSFLL